MSGPCAYNVRVLFALRAAEKTVELERQFQLPFAPFLGLTLESHGGNFSITIEAGELYYDLENGWFTIHFETENVSPEDLQRDVEYHLLYGWTKSQ
jgi:hypothetical protein